MPVRSPAGHHLPAILAAMAILGRIWLEGRAGAVVSIALGAAACATNPTPAPIRYGRATPPPMVAAPAPSLATPADSAASPLVLRNQPPLECAPFARSQSGVQIYGDAVTWWAQAEARYPRSQRPAEGAVLVLRGWKDDRRGHVAVVRAIVSERMIKVDHANWLHTGEITLNVPVADVSQNNDWSEVKVWNVTTASWGGRSYPALGFIQPNGATPQADPAAPTVVDPSTGQAVVG